MITVKSRVATIASVFLGLSAAAHAGSEQVIVQFEGPNGLFPNGPLISDAHGNLYGAAGGGGKTGGACLTGSANDPGGCGLIFKLSPPAAGKTAWTETILHEFVGADGAAPGGSLVMDSTGVLYGTTVEGGGGDKACPANPINGVIAGCGIAFKLTPPAAGKTAWTETVLHQFSGTDGADPGGSLIFDKGGNLYGVAHAGGDSSSLCAANPTGVIAGCGTAFELVKPVAKTGTWTLKVLHNFGVSTDGRFPISGLTLDAVGNLYGVTQAGGRVEAACKGEMSLNITPGCGVAYKLVKPSIGHTAWTETILHQFTGVPDGAIPGGALLLIGGKLYGVTAAGGAGTTIGSTDTAGNGTVFSLSPPAEGKTAWAEAILYRFGSKPNAYQPEGVLLSDAKGGLYGVTSYGGAFNFGTVYDLAPPAAGRTAWLETTMHTFTIGLDGIAPTFGLVRGTGGKLYGTTVFNNTFKTGQGDIFQITP